MDNKYLLEYFDEIITEDFGAVNVLGLAIGISLHLVRQYYKQKKVYDILKKGEKRCKEYDGIKKEKCLQDVRKVFLEKKIYILEKVRSRCFELKDREKRLKCYNKPSFVKEKEKLIQQLKQNQRIAGIFQPSFYHLPISTKS